MRVRFRNVSKAALKASALVSLLVLAGCAGGKKPKTHLVYEERPVEALYDAGMTRLDHREWTEANNYFEEVERQHPYSEWSRRSIIMEIYANYMGDKYTESSAAADHFIALYPGSPLTPYAYYMKANNQFEQIVDVGRDQEFTTNAQVMFNDMIKRYPNSEYAKDARLKLDMIKDQLSGKEMEIGRFYLTERQPLAAIGRFKSVITTYQTTSHAPEALYRLVEANLMLGIVDEAKRNAAVLGYNYPGDHWYQLAYKLMKDKGETMSVAPDPKGKSGNSAPKPVKKGFLSGILPHC